VNHQEERDPVSGHVTTGHEWNGIKELNTPVPRAIWVFLITFAAFAIVWTILMPSWPGVSGYFGGLLGADQHKAVAESIVEAMDAKANWTDTIVAGSYDDLLANEDAMKFVRIGGKTLFGDNCAACHGLNAQGNPGYPNIAQAPTLWGGDPETIAETIRVGINSQHPDTRISQMPAFGRDQMLTLAQVDQVAQYVLTLSDPAKAAQLPADTLAAGKQVFADNCASCHGDDGKGLPDTGAANLTDQFWIYGGDFDTVRMTIYSGRQGHMPSWEGRLSDYQRKLLALYVLDLRSKEAQ